MPAPKILHDKHLKEQDKNSNIVKVIKDGDFHKLDDNLSIANNQKTMTKFKNVWAKPVCHDHRRPASLARSSFRGLGMQIHFYKEALQA